MSTRSLYLSFKTLFALFGFYLLAFIAGSTAALFALSSPTQTTDSVGIFNNSIIGSIGMSVVGSSIFYFRKLYKLCFAESVNFDTSAGNRVKRIGTAMYFFARPFFSVGFALLVVIGLKAGLIVSTGKNIDLQRGFLFISMFASFFVGFSSGKFIKRLEENGHFEFQKDTK